MATTIEFVADEQMKRFKKTALPGEYINRGLWKYSRHPNYFGEITFWVGLYVMSLGVSGSPWWTGIGVVVILLMFLFASIPMMEERTLRSKPHYAAQIKTVSVLVPWFRRS
jgi:steroid 5-alpha reductase family enzyme